MSNCGYPEGVEHLHVERCYQGGRRDALAEVGAAHLGPEVELRLERMADAANEAELRWLLGEWLTEIADLVARQP